MGLDVGLVGTRFGPLEVSWDSKDALLYALSVGAGMDNPSAELEFTTENSEGVQQQVLPTFPLVLKPPMSTFADYDPLMSFHGEQQLELFGPVPVCGTVSITTEITGVYDKGSGAVVETESIARDAATDALLFKSGASEFIKGQGGFGGPRGVTTPWERPQRQPDHQITYITRPEQPLLYRLNGDRYPYHSDPTVAARAGFTKPIMHGLCTLAFTARALLHTVCGSDPSRFRSIRARYSSPMTPGNSLIVSIWADNDGVLFQTSTPDGVVVIDRGRFAATTV